MTATIAPEPTVTKAPESVTRTRTRKAKRSGRKRRSSARRPIPPIRWRTVPFAVFVSALLCVGSVALLIVNNSLAAGSFERARLKAERTLLFEQEQALNQEVLALSAPNALRASAQKLGMVPAASSAFLDLSTGKIFGIPTATSGSIPAIAAPEADPDDEDETATDSSAVTAPSGPVVREPLGPITEGDGAQPGGDVPDDRQDEAAVVDPTEPGDGAELSSGTAQDRAIVSGGGE